MFQLFGGFSKWAFICTVTKQPALGVFDQMQVPLCGEGACYLLQISRGIELGGGGKQTQVPFYPCGFQFVLALVHIQFFFLNDSLADL